MERQNLAYISKFFARQTDMTELVNGIKDALYIVEQLDRIRQEFDLKYHVIRRTDYCGFPGAFGQGTTRRDTRRIEGVHTCKEERRIFADYRQEYRRRKADIVTDEVVRRRGFKYRVGFFLGGCLETEC